MKSILLFCSALTLFVACTEQNSSNTIVNTSDTVKSEVSASKKYQCPMDCEKGKTYTDTGSCPVCEMDLEIK